MGAIGNLRMRLHHYLLNKHLEKSRVLRLSSSLDAAKSIGLLFDATDVKERKVVLQYAENLRKSGKKVSLLGFLNAKQIDETLPFDHFSNKEISFSYRPKSELATNFANEVLDLLLVMNPNQHTIIEYLAAISKASFRAGSPTDLTDCCDLMIETKNPHDLQHFLKEIEFFLNKMTTQHEPIPA